MRNKLSLGGNKVPIVTGGEITDVVIDGIVYRVHSFTSSGVAKVFGGIRNAEVMIIGGGGSGAPAYATSNPYVKSGGSGGGAGEFKIINIPLATGEWDVVVGEQTGRPNGTIQTFDGNPSSAFGYTAIGGKGSQFRTKGGDSGNGFLGGTFNNNNGGGGGGSTSNGANAITGTNGSRPGGTGTTINFRGFEETFCSGGLGRMHPSGNGRNSGSNGAENTGNGGGGSSSGRADWVTGGAGGSGLVCFRYPIGIAPYITRSDNYGAQSSTSQRSFSINVGDPFENRFVVFFLGTGSTGSSTVTDVKFNDVSVSFETVLINDGSRVSTMAWGYVNEGSTVNVTVSDSGGSRAVVYSSMVVSGITNPNPVDILTSTTGDVTFPVLGQYSVVLACGMRIQAPDNSSSRFTLLDTYYHARWATIHSFYVSGKTITETYTDQEIQSLPVHAERTSIVGVWR